MRVRTLAPLTIAINSLKYDKIGGMFTAVLSVSICSSAIYQFGYFNSLSLSFRSIPITISDLSIEIVRTIPMAILLLSVVVASNIVSNKFINEYNIVFNKFYKFRIIVGEFIRSDGASKFNIRLKKNELKNKIRNSIKKRNHKILIYVIFLFIIFSISAFSLPISQSLASKADGAAQSLGVLMLFPVGLFFLFGIAAHFKLAKSISVIFSILCSIFIFYIWGCYNAAIQIDSAQEAVIYQDGKILPIKIIGTFEKGLLVNNNGYVEFIFWDKVDTINYNKASMTKFLKDLTEAGAR